MPLRLPEEYADRVDKKRWGKEIDVNNEEEHTAEAVTGQILYKMMWYKMREYDDRLLWECFREGFQDWTKELFALGETEDVRYLRNHLREYGVFVQEMGNALQRI